MKSKINYRLIMLLITTIVVVILIVTVFLIRQKQQQTQELIEYVPAKAVSFIEFNLANQHFNNYLETHQHVKDDLESFFIKYKLLPNIWRGQAEIDRVALIFMPIQGNGEELTETWLIRGRKNIQQLAAYDLINYYYIVLNDQVAALSLSREAIWGMRDQKFFSGLGGVGDFDFNNQDFLMRGYYKKNQEQSKEQPESLLIKYFALDDKGTIYWQAQMPDEQKIFFDLTLPLANIKELPKVAEEYAGNFLELDRVLMARNFMLVEVLDIFKQEIANQLGVEWQVFEDYLNTKYQVEIEELYTFFKHPSLLILEPKSRISGLNNALNMQNYSYALVLEREFNEQEKQKIVSCLEPLIQNYLAFRFPVVKIKILPDQSTGLERIADIAQFNWQAIGEIKLIKHQDLEFAYSLNEQSLVFANDQSLLQRVLVALAASQDMVDEQAKEDEAFSLKFDADIFKMPYFNLGQEVWLGSQIKSKKLLIQGKILD